MPSGGAVTVTGANVRVDKTARAAGIPLAEGRYVEIAVRDEGTGIPRDDLPKIFDPYFTTKKGGTGLGLTASYAIVRKHGGYIGVDSEVGLGTTVHFYLPASDAPARALVPPPVPPEITGGKVLVMDDEEAVRSMLGRLLRRLGYTAVLTADGAEAIDAYVRARATSFPFDAVILDLTIPGGMGGRETIARLRELDPDVRAIVSSGYTEDAALANFEQYGFCARAAKPYTLEELSGALQRAMRPSGADPGAAVPLERAAESGPRHVVSRAGSA